MPKVPDHPAMQYCYLVFSPLPWYFVLFCVYIDSTDIYMPDIEFIKQSMNSFQTGIPVTKDWQ